LSNGKSLSFKASNVSASAQKKNVPLAAATPPVYVVEEDKSDLKSESELDFIVKATYQSEKKNSLPLKRPVPQSVYDVEGIPVFPMFKPKKQKTSDSSSTGGAMQEEATGAAASRCSPSICSPTLPRIY
jgi:hypothetical protein